MKRGPKTQPCPECGSPMVYQRRENLIEYKGHRRLIETLGFWCSNCGEGIVTGKPLQRSEQAFLALKAEVDELAKAGVAGAQMGGASRRRKTSTKPSSAKIEPKVKIPGPLAPNEVAELRKKLGLTQKKASVLLGAEVHSFQAYESGKVPISLPLSNLLRLLANDPKRLDELAGPTLVKAPRTGLPNPRKVVEVGSSVGSSSQPHTTTTSATTSRVPTRNTGTGA